MSLVVWLVHLFEIYLALGLLFALGFVVKGVQRVDPLAQSGTWGFRLLIFPGALALWPLLLARWCSARNPGNVPQQADGGGVEA